MDKIDLDELERVTADYDRRKEAARTFEIENFGDTTEERVCYMASLKQGEAVKAFEALRPLVARVRELETENRALRERVRELEELSDRAIDEAGYLLGCMPTLDCRVCDYHDYCPEPMPGYEPDIETCRAAMRIFCDPKGAQISEKAAKEAGE